MQLTVDQALCCYFVAGAVAVAGYFSQAFLVFGWVSAFIVAMIMNFAEL